jgi:hypothetical protein
MREITFLPGVRIHRQGWIGSLGGSPPNFPLMSWASREGGGSAAGHSNPLWDTGLARVEPEEWSEKVSSPRQRMCIAPWWRYGLLNAAVQVLFLEWTVFVIGL